MKRTLSEREGEEHFPSTFLEGINRHHNPFLLQTFFTLNDSKTTNINQNKHRKIQDNNTAKSDDFDDDDETYAQLITTSVEHSEKSLLEAYGISEWKEPSSLPAPEVFLTSRSIHTTLQRLKLHYGLETEFGSTLFYNVWASSQHRFYSQVMLALSPELYKKNVVDLKTFADSQPGVYLLKDVVLHHFVDKSLCAGLEDCPLKITEDLSTDVELRRVARFVIDNKQNKRFKLLTCKIIEWSEETDVMSTGSCGSCGVSIGSLDSIHLESGMMNAIEENPIKFVENSMTTSTPQFSDEDPSDPELLSVTDIQINERRHNVEISAINRWKTEGAFLPRLHIGPMYSEETKSDIFSPNLFYDGQCRVKCAPLLKKLYYKFFTYVPKMLDIEHILDLIRVQPSEKTPRCGQFSPLETHIFRELDRFKVSHCLKMEIAFGDICGMHIQKVPCTSHNWALLVLKLSRPPHFFVRRIMCSNSQRNEARKRQTDFTPNHISSKYDTHYLIGEERELKRIVALMIEADRDVGHIEQIYRQGLPNIDFPTQPCWEVVPSQIQKQKKEMVYPSKFCFESRYLYSEDEEEERQNELQYDSDEDSFPLQCMVSAMDEKMLYKYERRQCEITKDDQVKTGECFIQ